MIAIVSEEHSIEINERRSLSVLNSYHHCLRRRESCIGFPLPLSWITISLWSRSQIQACRVVRVRRAKPSSCCRNRTSHASLLRKNIGHFGRQRTWKASWTTIELSDNLTSSERQTWMRNPVGRPHWHRIWITIKQTRSKTCGYLRQMRTMASRLRVHQVRPSNRHQTRPV